MFGKKCSRCDKKVSREFEFCPYCGYELIKKREGGLLDEMDETREIDNLGINGEDIEQLTKDIGRQMGFGFIDSFPFNSIVRRLSKDIEKQFKDIDREIAVKRVKGKEQVIRKDGAEIRKTTFPGGFSVQIKMGGIPQNIPVQLENLQTVKASYSPRKTEKTFGGFSSSKQDKISRLPRREPETRVRRLTDKIIYEISLPGVRSLNNVSVNKLENSMEIKAITKDTAYFKLIPVGLPLKKYSLKDEKLILELSPEQ